MTPPDIIKVGFSDGKDNILLGGITREDKRLYFKYSDEYLRIGYNISPLKLSFDDKIQSPDTSIFNGLFGVFSDSIPDGWGLLLMDRFLMTRGVDISRVDPLTRLSIIGNDGAGAITYQPEFHDSSDETHFSNLADTYSQIAAIDKEGAISDLESIYKLGGSSGGARPKILINYNPETDTLSGKKMPNSDQWIIKFPSSTDYRDIAKVEYIYYQMALLSGINMNTSKLFEASPKVSFFGTKRFDRDKNKRVHMISAAGLLHDNYRYTALDYGHLLDVGFHLTKSVETYNKIIRLALFNVLALNRDDHSKNFSFLMEEGQWRFAPAYDLTYSTSSHGYQSTSVGGESKDIKDSNFQELVNHFGIRGYDNIVDEILEATSHFEELAQSVNLDETVYVSIKEAMLKKRIEFHTK